jgi:hypothetical protein
VKVSLRPSEANAFFVITITENKRRDDYRVEPIPSDFGRAFSVEKLGSQAQAEPYHVNLADQGHTCCCLGFNRYGYCRHVSALIALCDAGKL